MNIYQKYLIQVIIHISCLLIIPEAVSAQTQTGKLSGDSILQKTDSINSKLLNHKDDEKYLILEAIETIIDSEYTDLIKCVIFYNKGDKEIDVPKMVREADKLVSDTGRRANVTPPKSNQKETMRIEDNIIFFDDKSFTKEVSSMLKQSGYIDTTNKLFQSFNGTLWIRGVIKKMTTFEMQPRLPKNDYTNWYGGGKIEVIWYFRNTYGELIDSVIQWSYSDKFTYNDNEKMLLDLVKKSFLDMSKSPIYLRNIKMDTSFTIMDSLLKIKKPVQVVRDIEGAISASVTIKRKSGEHCSGFVISQDGYILTNYHIAVGEVTNKQEEVTVLLSDGTELPARMVRYNRIIDVALFKVEALFEKAFVLNDTKSYTKLMQIYTVGTPKTIELGQSLSVGMLSNERKINHTTLLQLSMSINSGNSGGPVFDQSGTLHGIIIGKLVGYATEGVCFAIPSYIIPLDLNLSFVD